MIFVDTSAWIDFFIGTKNLATETLRNSILTSKDLCTCGIVMTEVLQGIRSEKEFTETKEMLSGLIYLPTTQHIFLRSASIYRTLRKQGKTIRSPVDCLVAAVCLEHEVQLLHNDNDFNVISKCFPLRMIGG